LDQPLIGNERLRRGVSLTKTSSSSGRGPEDPIETRTTKVMQTIVAELDTEYSQ